MSFEKQITANIKNSKRSAGPRTEKGKQASRMNSRALGLTAKQVVIKGEDPAEFERVLQGLIDEYAPRTILEQQLIQQLAGYLWRLNRIPVFEASIFASHRLVVQKENLERRRKAAGDIHWAIPLEENPPMDLRHWLSDGELSGLQEEPEEPEESSEQREIREEEEALEKARNAVLDLGRVLLRDASQNDAIGKLSRYEVHLENALERTIRQLEKLQDKRLAELKGNNQIVDLEPDKSEK